MNRAPMRKVFVVAVVFLVIGGYQVILPPTKPSVQLQMRGQRCPTKSKVYPMIYPDCNTTCPSEISEMRTVGFKLGPNRGYLSLESNIHKALSVLGEFGPIGDKQLRNMHINMGYYCCLSHAHARLVDEAIKEYEWPAGGVPIRFSRAMCNEDRPDGRTSVILLLDQESNAALLDIQEEIEELAISSGVKLTLRRRNQQDFHMTLGTAYYHAYRFVDAIEAINREMPAQVWNLENVRVFSPCSTTAPNKEFKCLGKTHLPEPLV